MALTYSASKEKADEVVDSIAKCGGKAVAIKADAADPESVRLSVAKTMEAFGGLDILVNNAGILAISPIEKFSMEDFDRMIAVNVRGLFVATQEAVRHMRDGGRIIHIGSCNSDRIPFGGSAVRIYPDERRGGRVHQSLRARSRSARITVNNVQPGPTETDMNPGTSQFADLNPPIHCPQSLPGKVEEIASFVAYLASPEAGYITERQFAG